MDASIVAAIIGALGSVAAAIITVAYGTQAPPEPQGLHKRRRWKLAILIVVIAAVVGILIAYVLRDATRQRLTEALPPRQGYRPVMYEKVGLGFMLPQHWRVDDAAFRFGGGDIDLIRDFDPRAFSISQGIKFRLINVQENYVNNPQAEYENELAVLKEIDPAVTNAQVSLAGMNGMTFTYRQRGGDRMIYAERMWVRVVPRVKLEVYSVSNLDQAARRAFSEERSDILKSLVIDETKRRELEGQLKF